MNPDSAGPVEPATHPPHQPSRRIHYWILGFVLLLVTASFLFVRYDEGPIQGPTRSRSHPGTGPGWLKPARRFLAHLRRHQKWPSPSTSRKPGPRQPVPGRFRRPRPRMTESPPRPVQSVLGSSAVAGRSSPILAWSSPLFSQTPSRRRRMLQGLIRKLEPAEPERGRPRPSRMAASWKEMRGLIASGRNHDRNRDWLRRERQSGLPKTAVILPPPRRPVLLPGSVIAAVLLSEINSDLPGMIVARVTRTVFDSVHEKVCMIPRGSTLIGYYSSEVAQGQTRVLASFSEVIFPDGGRVSLGGMQAADAYGASGLRDQVNNHFWKIFGSSFLIAALTALLPTSQSTVVVSPGLPTAAVIGPAAGQALVNTSQAILGRNEEIPPTLIIRPGFRFLVMVSRPIAWSADRDRRAGTLPQGPAPENPVGRSRGLHP